MSFKHMQLVAEHSATRGADRSIMYALAYRADEHGVCWPGLERLASESGLTRRCVYGRLPKIEAQGEVVIERQSQAVQTKGGKQAANRYRITIFPAQGREQHSLPSGTKVGNGVHKGREQDAPKVGNRMHEGREQRSPESSLNSNQKQSENREARIRGFRVI